MIYYVNKFVSNLIESEIMDGWEEGSKKTYQQQCHESHGGFCYKLERRRLRAVNITKCKFWIKTTNLGIDYHITVPKFNIHHLFDFYQ